MNQPDPSPKPFLQESGLSPAGGNHARMRVLIMTVGVPSDPREDLAEALGAEIAAIRPEVTHLVASPQSLKNARRLAEIAAGAGAAVGGGASGGMGAGPGADAGAAVDAGPAAGAGAGPGAARGDGGGRIEVVSLTSAHDVQETFRLLNRIISGAMDRGVRREEIAINFTSGTKTMGLGAALSGVFNRIHELRYITGVAPGQNRKSRLIKAEPGAIFAAQDMLRARAQIMELRFGSAQALLRGINESLLEDSERAIRSSLMRLARAYAAWDAFHPAGFLDDYAEVDFGPAALAAFRLGDAQLAEVKALAAEMAGGMEAMRLTIDLYNNGLRRFQSGQIDDAVIRLYRSMEALAQWVLRRDYGIDMNNLDTRKAPPRDRARFEALRSVEDGRVKLDLRRAYELLGLLGSEVGGFFNAENGLAGFLLRSDASILTRGLTPIAETEARRLFELTHGLIEIEIKNFHEVRCRLQFPWIDEGDAGPWNCPIGGSGDAHIQPAAKETLK